MGQGRNRRLAALVKVAVVAAIWATATGTTATAGGQQPPAAAAQSAVDAIEAGVPVKLTPAQSAEVAAGPTGLAMDAMPVGDGANYVVRFVAGSDPARQTADLARSGIEVGATFHDVFPGAVVHASAAEAATMREDPAVLSVVSDQIVVLDDPVAPTTTTQAVQGSATWGIDRSDQRNLPLSGTYGYDYTGAGVDVYVLDSGIRHDHVDFGGRVLPGWYAIYDGYLSSDCHGHGTHVAGTIGSATFGIAKGVTLIPVRVAGCNGSGLISGMIAGLDWIVARHTTGTPAVLNISMGAAANSALDAAVRAAINDGITVVVAAGNAGDLACNVSPARTPAAITVAATDSTDYSPNWSNYGSCVDVFAPGDSITSTWNTSASATAVLMGTSMASPHVAGAAALLLQLQPASSPAQTSAWLTGAATPGVVTNGGPGSPDALLFALPTPLPPPPPVPANDNLAAAASLTIPAPGPTTGTNVAATKEPGEPDHAGGAGLTSVWWTFTAPAAGTVTLSSEGSSFDTLLGVYTGASVTSLSAVASNDDFGPNLWSQVEFPVAAGVRYHIAVDGYSGATGDVALQSVWQPPTGYVALSPVRLMDTRTGLGGPPGKLYSVAALTVTGSAGVPADAAAVVLNVTATEPDGAGFLTVFPCGSPLPNGSSVNFVGGSTVANAVFAKVGAAGAVCLFASTPVHVVIDVNGYFPAGSNFVPLTPARLLDSRPGAATIDGGAAGAGVAAGGSITQLQVTNRGGVPADAAAVVLNVTVTGTTGAGYVTVFPCGSGVPNGSNLNYVAGATVANAVVAKVGPGGSICVYTSAGTHLVADVNGFFPAGAGFTSLVPARLLETRSGLSTVDGRFNGLGHQLAGGSTVALVVTGRAEIPLNASAVVLNVTVTETSSPGFVTVYPCGTPLPNAANLNFAGGATTPNAVVAKVAGNGTVCVFVSAGTHLIVDTAGYFVST